MFPLRNETNVFFPLAPDTMKSMSSIDVLNPMPLFVTPLIFQWHIAYQVHVCVYIYIYTYTYIVIYLYTNIPN